VDLLSYGEAPFGISNRVWNSIYSLSTEQDYEDVVSLGMHAVVTALDTIECLRKRNRDSPARGHAQTVGTP
jgi:hypothetical protein